MTVVAEVVGVALKRQIVTLRSSRRTVDLKVRDPSQIRLLKMGYQVEATYTEAAVISVEPAPKTAPLKQAGD